MTSPAALVGQAAASQEVLFRYPNPNTFAPEIEKYGRTIHADIDASDDHEDHQHSVSGDPVIDAPGPNPRDQRLDRCHCDHELDGELSSCQQAGD
jgi:hypothetical protein